MERSNNPPGTFCWVELASSDPGRARQFYTELFGWTVSESPMPGGPSYIRFLNHGRVAAAMYGVDGSLPNAAVDVWGAYVSVDDVDAAAARATELGGELTQPPFDVPEAGRMAVLRDPQGAPFSLWQAGGTSGLGVKGEPGSVCWTELLTRDTDAAAAFYTELFGWKRLPLDVPSGAYTSFLRGDEPECGMMQMQGEQDDVRPHWVVTFGVRDCDAAVTRAEALGATVVVPATNVPDIGRFAWLSDPSGAVFGVMRLEDSSG